MLLRKKVVWVILMKREKQSLEAGKILNIKNLPISATCVRVPVFIGHALSCNVEFKEQISLSEVQQRLESFPGISISKLATSMDSTETDEVIISRLRTDKSRDHSFNMWVVCNNMRKGAALNVVQIIRNLKLSL